MNSAKEWANARKLEDNKFIPTKKYISKTALYSLVNDIHHKFIKGSLLKLVSECNTSAPEFEDQYGNKGFCCWYRLKPFMNLGAR